MRDGDDARTWLRASRRGSLGASEPYAVSVTGIFTTLTIEPSFALDSNTTTVPGYVWSTWYSALIV